MSLETFKAALEFAVGQGEYITIGGGEPTVHPQFFEFLGLALAANALHGDGPILVVTNGKRKEHALKLAAMAKKGMLMVELSQDEYHDPISSEVVVAFTKRTRSYQEEGSNDWRGIRDTSDNLQGAGRAQTELGIPESCCCEDILVAPDGTLYSCGCKHTPMGTVFQPDIPLYYDRDLGHTLNDYREAA